MNPPRYQARSPYQMFPPYPEPYQPTPQEIAAAQLGMPVCYARPSTGMDMSPDKAKTILHDGTVHGHPLTEKQRGLFGAIAGRSDNSRGGADDMDDARPQYRRYAAQYAGLPLGHMNPVTMAQFARLGVAYPGQKRRGG